jgi:hypothetical protein
MRWLEWCSLFVQSSGMLRQKICRIVENAKNFLRKTLRAARERYGYRNDGADIGAKGGSAGWVGEPFGVAAD